MPASKAQQRAVAKYMAANYDEIKVRVPKGRKAEIEVYANQCGESINGLGKQSTPKYAGSKRRGMEASSG